MPIVQEMCSCLCTIYERIWAKWTFSTNKCPPFSHYFVFYKWWLWNDGGKPYFSFCFFYGCPDVRLYFHTTVLMPEKICPNIFFARSRQKIPGCSSARHVTQLNVKVWSKWWNLIDESKCTMGWFALSTSGHLMLKRLSLGSDTFQTKEAEKVLFLAEASGGPTTCWTTTKTIN